MVVSFQFSVTSCFSDNYYLKTENRKLKTLNIYV